MKEEERGSSRGAGEEGEEGGEGWFGEEKWEEIVE